MSENTQSQLEQIAALLDSWRSDDSPEGELSPRWLLGQVREVLGLSDLDYLTRALSSLLTEAGESPHPNPAELVTQVGTVMRRARRPMTDGEAQRVAEDMRERAALEIEKEYITCERSDASPRQHLEWAAKHVRALPLPALAQRPAPLTEEEADRWAELQDVNEQAHCYDRKSSLAATARLLYACSRGEIPPEVRTPADRPGFWDADPSIGRPACACGIIPHRVGCPRATWDPEVRKSEPRPKPPSRELIEALYQLGLTLETKAQRDALRAVQRIVHDSADPVLTFDEEAEIIASAPGTIAPGQRPISDPLALDPEDGTLCASCRAPRNEIHSPLCVRRAGVNPGRIAPIDPDSGTPKWPEQATSMEKSSGEWPSWAQGEGAIAPPFPEMAVTTGTDDDDNA